MFLMYHLISFVKLSFYFVVYCDIININISENVNITSVQTIWVIEDIGC